jgi:chemotaxis signal transduction protein
VVEVRDEYMPVVDLERVFDVPRFDFEHVSNIMVVVEAEGGRVALLVDELLGQQQVVVKNLESQLPQGGRRRVGRHHHGRRPRGPDPGRGLAGAAQPRH